MFRLCFVLVLFLLPVLCEEMNKAEMFDFKNLTDSVHELKQSVPNNPWSDLDWLTSRAREEAVFNTIWKLALANDLNELPIESLNAAGYQAGKTYLKINFKQHPELVQLFEVLSYVGLLYESNRDELFNMLTERGFEREEILVLDRHMKKHYDVYEKTSKNHVATYLEYLEPFKEKLSKKQGGFQDSMLYFYQTFREGKVVQYQWSLDLLKLFHKRAQQILVVIGVERLGGMEIHRTDVRKEAERFTARVLNGSYESEVKSHWKQTTVPHEGEIK